LIFKMGQGSFADSLVMFAASGGTGGGYSRAIVMCGLGRMHDAANVLGKLHAINYCARTGKGGAG
jgi:hypothetical protein